MSLSATEVQNLIDTCQDCPTNLHRVLGDPERLLRSTVCPNCRAEIVTGYLVPGLGYCCMSCKASILIWELVQAIKTEIEQPSNIPGDGGGSSTTFTLFMDALAAVELKPKRSSLGSLIQEKAEEFEPAAAPETVVAEEDEVLPHFKPFVPAPPPKRMNWDPDNPINLMSLPPGTIVQFKGTDQGKDLNYYRDNPGLKPGDVPALDRELIRRDDDPIVGPAITRKFTGEISIERPDFDRSKLSSTENDLFADYKPGTTTLRFSRPEDVAAYEAAEGDPDIMAALQEAVDEEFPEETRLDKEKLREQAHDQANLTSGVPKPNRTRAAVRNMPYWPPPEGCPDPDDPNRL
jgi:hypothetical protein